MHPVGVEPFIPWSHDASRNPSFRVSLSKTADHRLLSLKHWSRWVWSLDSAFWFNEQRVAFRAYFELRNICRAICNCPSRHFGQALCNWLFFFIYVFIVRVNLEGSICRSDSYSLFYICLVREGCTGLESSQNAYICAYIGCWNGGGPDPSADILYWGLWCNVLGEWRKVWLWESGVFLQRGTFLFRLNCRCDQW